MNFIKPLLIILVFGFISSSAYGQSVEIVPHYPNTAFMINRLLPFSVLGDSTVDIVSVNVQQNDSCQAFPDRFHKNIFHFHCTAPTQVSAEVVYLLNTNERFSSMTSVINVAETANPSSSPAPTTEGPQPTTTSPFSKPQGEE